MSVKLQTEVVQQLNDAWFEIAADDKYVINPFDRVTIDTENPEEFYKRLTSLMVNPDYFYFMCKHILNIDLLPVQALMLKELWTHKFPMLIASRGFGKLLRPNEKIRIKNGWTTIENISVGDKVYGSNGELCNVTYKTPLQKNVNMYRITLRDGRSIDCCEDHMWKVWDKNKNRKKSKTVWSELTTKEMADNYFWKRKGAKSSGKEFRYALPINASLNNEEDKELPLHPYVVGALLGDGTISSKTIQISSKDTDLIERFANLLPRGYKLSPPYKEKDYRIIRSDKTLPSFRHLCIEAKIWGHNSHTKFIPDEYKFSSHEQKLELLKGLMDTDGYSRKNVIEYYTVSETLCDDIADIVRSLGISCKKNVRESWLKGKRYSDCYVLRIYTNKSIFTLDRKLSYKNHTKSKQGQSKHEKVFITNIEKIENGEGYCISVDSPDNTYITKDYIVTHNTFMLSLYCMLRAALMPNRKIVVVGAAFRQSKFLYDYMLNIWNNAPILRDMCDENSGPRKETDMCRMTINGSTITALPIGDGQKIRGQRANDIISDEFASMSREIFENVIAGFAAVSASPVENVKEIAKRELAKELGITLPKKDEVDSLQNVSNQIVISGTAYYDFNHFAEYWKRWKKIIESKGDMKYLSNEVFGGEEVPESFNWTDYSIIRIPVDLIPKGFMDEGQIARSKATVHNGIYLMEFGAVFAKDSQGFFKRSLIESCVGTQQNPISLPSGDIWFDPLLVGFKDRKYVMAVDPASEVDNFSIVILEVHPDHRRIVYCWTFTRQEHRERLKKGLTKEDNFFNHCARKIRDLMRMFPIVHIAMDAQGGGLPVSEALQDKEKLLAGERRILPVIEEDNPKDTDDEEGLHILEMCQNAKYEWYAEANHGMRKDFEDKTLLFPRFDPVTIELSIQQDKSNNRVYDTLEDCVMEIEELKNELSLIEITKKPSGRDHWDTPEIKIGVGKKERMRKDRYSALMMANMAARSINFYEQQKAYNCYGGFAVMNTKNARPSGPAYDGPAWFTSQINGLY